MTKEANLISEGAKHTLLGRCPPVKTRQMSTSQRLPRQNHRNHTWIQCRLALQCTFLVRHWWTFPWQRTRKVNSPSSTTCTGDWHERSKVLSRHCTGLSRKSVMALWASLEKECWVKIRWIMPLWSFKGHTVKVLCSHHPFLLVEEPNAMNKERTELKITLLHPLAPLHHPN